MDVFIALTKAAVVPLENVFLSDPPSILSSRLATVAVYVAIPDVASRWVVPLVCDSAVTVIGDPIVMVGTLSVVATVRSSSSAVFKFLSGSTNVIPIGSPEFHSSPASSPCIVIEPVEAIALYEIGVSL